MTASLPPPFSDPMLERDLQEALSHHQAGRLQEAEALYRTILLAQPRHPDANHNMGVLAVQCGQAVAALPYFETALQASPEQPHHWLSYIETLIQAGRAEAARQVLALGRKHGLQGIAAEALAERLAKPVLHAAQEEATGRHPDLANDEPSGPAVAEQSISGPSASSQHEIAPSPQEIEALMGFYGQGRLDEVEALARSLTLRFPRHGLGWKALGGVAVHQKRLEEALEYVQKSAELSPDDGEVHSNLAYILSELGRKLEAETHFRQALAITPNDPAAHNDLGGVLLAQGRLSEAEACFRQALEISPDYEDAYGNLLFTLNYQADKSAEEIFEAYREYDARFGLPLRAQWRPHDNDTNAKRRLKVGYVSPDFCNHAVRFFLEPLLAHHDKTVLEVVAYAELSKEDAATERYKRYVDHWVATKGMSDAVLAERIRADGIDILVDLAGHTARNRLGVFARKPAPVSLSWLGYGYTTGLTAVDYLLTDFTSAPAGSEGLFSEQPWRLATPGYTYLPAEGMGPVSPLPAMERGYVTFGMLTRAVRINYRSIRVWSEILKRVAGSRLVVNSENFKETSMQNALAAKFAAYGIAPERLEIGFQSPPWDVLRGMDIGLDCFPHNSGTTLFECLYMGVPYVSLAGRPSVGRLGSSILEGAGHREWIACNEDEYVEKAVALASDLPKLAALRMGLRAEMEGGALMNAPAFARKVEAAYKEMFAIWRAANQSP